eukprot:15347906-Ditylum_brightwellii.AAC.1
MACPPVPLVWRRKRAWSSVKPGPRVSNVIAAEDVPIATAVGGESCTLGQVDLPGQTQVSAEGSCNFEQLWTYCVMQIQREQINLIAKANTEEEAVDWERQ